MFEAKFALLRLKYKGHTKDVGNTVIKTQTVQSSESVVAIATQYDPRVVLTGLLKHGKAHTGKV